MVDPRLYDTDAFVVLEPNQSEQILTPEELSDRLHAILEACKDDLPPDVQQFGTIEEQTHYLMETACELDLGPDRYFQWFAIRLEK
ncbi:MAG: chlororespiratory reduction protein 7 [Merismopedia sp. SIO2A8]|nr:chlororespiratory reduction protein 7 [Merismopedia sp. SIO2A8]